MPGAIVEWTIVANPGGDSSTMHDVERLRRLLIALGYTADLGTRMEAIPNAEFFSFTKSQRYSLALFWDARGDIRVKFVEHGEKRLSSSGRQHAALIAYSLQKEFGNRIKGSAPEVSPRITGFVMHG